MGQPTLWRLNRARERKQKTNEKTLNPLSCILYQRFNSNIHDEFYSTKRLALFTSHPLFLLIQSKSRAETTKQTVQIHVKCYSIKKRFKKIVLKKTCWLFKSLRKEVATWQKQGKHEVTLNQRRFLKLQWKFYCILKLISLCEVFRGLKAKSLSLKT